MAVLQELESTVAELTRRVGPSVIGLVRGWGRGSGVVIGAGRILTNAHNIRHEDVVVTFADGRQQTGRVAGADPDLDLAVLDVDTGEAPAIEWVDEPERPAIGRAVFALANPGGRGLRITPGFVSSEVRSFRGPRGRRIPGAIEHTAPLPRGSSGGPLVDGEGHLLGLNTLRVDGGLILAIPADASFRERVEGLGRGETPRRVRLGVAIAPPRVARRLRRAVGLPELEGVLVRAVEEASPAQRAGIERGDLIVAVGERAIERVDVLYEALDRVKQGGTLELSIVRGTDERQVSVSF